LPERSVDIPSETFRCFFSAPYFTPINTDELASGRTRVFNAAQLSFQKLFFEQSAPFLDNNDKVASWSISCSINALFFYLLNLAKNGTFSYVSTTPQSPDATLF
jgi:hypothetical protein